ncbi:hypothetical protein LOAG_16077, partial [Loa loa]
LVHIDANVHMILPVVIVKHSHLMMILVPYHLVTTMPNVIHIVINSTHVNVVL